jgi:deoxyribonuclease-4
VPAQQFRFGTVGTPSATPPHPGGSVGAILYLASQGLRALELAWVRSVRITPASCEEIRKTASEQDLLLSVHAPYFINLNADEEEWPKSRKRLMDAAKYGNLSGATDVVFHPGSYMKRTPQEALQVAIPRLRQCVEEMRAAGNPITLRPETMGKSALLGSLQDNLLLAQEIEGVKPCLDFSHLHARRGDGSLNSLAEWKALLGTYADALGEESLQELHCHLSGIEYSAKGERSHLMLAESDFNLNALLQALKDCNCAGRILCESPDMEQDAQIIKDAWAHISGEEK